MAVKEHTSPRKIAVVATALRKSGGITIYNQFLSHLIKCKGHHEYVVFKSPVTPECDVQGITVIDVDTTTFLKRLFFDICGCRILLRRIHFKPDVVLSLQNFGIWGLRRCPQFVYYHNPLALFPQEWNVFRKTERGMFVHKHIYPIIAKISFSSSTCFFVQTEYIKQQFERRFNIEGSRVSVCFPDIDAVDVDKLPLTGFPADEIHFMYPATPLVYKNHKTLALALAVLKERNDRLLSRIRIHLTISEDDLPQLVNLVVSNGIRDNFIFEGVVPHDRLLSMINHSCGLLFPSEMETLGLPLIESASLGVPILVSDLDYSHAVLSQYAGTHYVPVHDYVEWAQRIRDISESKPRYADYCLPGKSMWDELISVVQKELESKSL